MERKNHDVIDALLISAFFAGYALVLAIAKRVPRSIPTLDSNRLQFFRGIRDALIEQENNAGAPTLELTDGR